MPSQASRAYRTPHSLHVLPLAPAWGFVLSSSLGGRVSYIEASWAGPTPRRTTTTPSVPRVAPFANVGVLALAAHHTHPSPSVAPGVLHEPRFRVLAILKMLVLE